MRASTAERISTRHFCHLSEHLDREKGLVVTVAQQVSGNFRGRSDGRLRHHWMVTPSELCRRARLATRSVLTFSDCRAVVAETSSHVALAVPGRFPSQ
jgi:hypothetical protein